MAKKRAACVSSTTGSSSELRPTDDFRLKMYKVSSRNSIKDDSRSMRVSSNGNERISPDSLGANNSHSTASANMEEWRRGISAPTRYRVGPVSINLKLKDFLHIFVAILFMTVLVILVYASYMVPTGSTLMGTTRPVRSLAYDDKYPLTKPIIIPNGKKYPIAVITDLDHSSKVRDSLWKSLYLKGYLTVSDDKAFQVQFDSEGIDLHSSIGQGGRGMELSELIVFNGNMITVDDRTGIVYKIVDKEVVPWVILTDGAGDVSKGFKSEWATVKDGALYVGGLGKEWTTTEGKVLNINPQYVKRISPDGSVEHLDWHDNYNAMRKKAGFSAPGYMIHESGVWSHVHRKWYFLPRRASKEMYDDKLDERRATNILLVCDESFLNIEVINPFGPASLTHGFSSFKFIPGTGDRYILALKSEENDGKTASYIMVLDLKGNMIMKEKKIAGNYKYEGVEFT